MAAEDETNVETKGTESEESGIKLVIRGLPFEAEVKHVCDHFSIDESCLKLITWQDSGRCKGHAFVTVGTKEEADVIRTFDGTDFQVSDNTRVLKITDFVPRPRRSRRNRRNKREGDDNNNSDNNTETETRDFEQDDESQREVYVSNVPFKAEREDFHRVFEDCGEIEDITIPTVYNSGKPKGFAFVRFKTQEGRDNAVNRDGTMMMDRQLGVRPNKGRPTGGKPRERKAPRTGLSEKPEGCTTIFVGNLPWEAEEKDLENAFSSCGEIKNTRIVRQSWTGKSRGFGYVEFEEEASVDTAVQQQLILDGRTLRLDYTDSITSNNE